jgi:hypothetical protein
MNAENIIINFNKLRSMVEALENQNKSQEYITGTLQGIILGIMDLLDKANTQDTQEILKVVEFLIDKNTKE